jgi:hypothetical protein
MVARLLIGAAMQRSSLRLLGGGLQSPVAPNLRPPGFSPSSRRRSSTGAKSPGKPTGGSGERRLSGCAPGKIAAEILQSLFAARHAPAPQ